MIDMKLVDSNIFVYAFDISEPHKYAIASKVLSEIFKGNHSITLSTQNLSEYYNVVTKKIKYPIPKIEARETIEEISSLENIHIKTITTETIILATKISEKYNIHYWDSLIVAVMKENNIHEIITENDKDFKKIPWITTINPFN